MRSVIILIKLLCMYVCMYLVFTVTRTLTGVNVNAAYFVAGET